MPRLTTDDGVELYYESAGEGTPIVLVHEFAGDHRSFEPQLRYLGRRYRCIAYNARGYPPSGVPESEQSYSQVRAREDVRAVLDALGLEKAHVLGISMGSFATLHFGLAYPARALSLGLGGCGTGAPPSVRAQFQTEARSLAERLLEDGMEAVAERYASTATRVQFQNKDPRGWAEFKRMLAEHSALGSANTMRGVQARRPSLYDMEGELAALRVPTLVMSGDEDEACLDASLYLKRTIPSAGLVLLPKTGHTLNLEEPALFNQIYAEFLHQVEAGRWTERDPRSLGGRLLSRD